MYQRVLTLVCFCIVTNLNIFCQTTPEKSKSKKFTTGFSVGINSGTIEFKPSAKYAGNDSILSIFSNNRTGIEVGLAVDYAVSERLSISSQANITIFNGIFKNDAEPDVISRGMEIPAKLEFPIHFIFKYPLDKNKLQIILGPNFKYHMNSDVGPNRNELKSYDFALDIGIGFEKPTTYFNFIPKIKYSIGLLNLVNNKQFMYQRGIERLQLHTLTLCFDFKG